MTGFNQNLGKPGVVYIIRNPGILYVKVGCSTRSGAHRAAELNRQATTGIPAEYHCVFEVQTQDCGRAELLVFERLAIYRRGGWGQEWFNVDTETARQHVLRACADVDRVVAPQSRPPRVFRPLRSINSHPSWIFLLPVAWAVMALLVWILARPR